MSILTSCAARSACLKQWLIVPSAITACPGCPACRGGAPADRDVCAQGRAPAALRHCKRHAVPGQRHGALRECGCELGRGCSWLLLAPGSGPPASIGLPCVAVLRPGAASRSPCCSDLNSTLDLQACCAALCCAAGPLPCHRPGRHCGGVRCDRQLSGLPAQLRQLAAAGKSGHCRAAQRPTTLIGQLPCRCCCHCLPACREGACPGGCLAITVAALHRLAAQRQRSTGCRGGEVESVRRVVPAGQQCWCKLWGREAKWSVPKGSRLIEIRHFTYGAEWTVEAVQA